MRLKGIKELASADEDEELLLNRILKPESLLDSPG